jgi:hypothetical protein
MRRLTWKNVSLDVIIGAFHDAAVEIGAEISAKAIRGIAASVERARRCAIVKCA